LRSTNSNRRRYLRLHSDRNECEFEWSDRTRNVFNLRLFSASQLRDCFAPHFSIEHVRGLDVFHTRFWLDLRWNPPELLEDSGALEDLALLEEAWEAKAAFIDRTTPIVLGARIEQRRAIQQLVLGYQPVTDAIAARGADHRQPLRAYPYRDGVLFCRRLHGRRAAA
jgi:hypothetical protein